MNFNLNKNFVSLRCSLYSSDLKIETHDHNDLVIEAPELRKHTLDQTFNIDFNNNVLKISEKGQRWFGLFGNHQQHSSLILKVPKNFTIDGEIKIYSGDLTISNVTFAGVIKNYSGDALIDQCSLHELEVKLYSGDLKISESNFLLKSDATISTMSGDVAINFLSYQTDKKTSIKSMSGDVKLSGDFPEHLVQTKQAVSNFKFDFEMSGAPKNQAKNNQSAQQSVAKILDMLEAGKINSTEATKLIKAIKG